MLKIDPTLVARVNQASQPEDLHDLVQSAIELEHATIPTYLAAYFTLKPGTNEAVAGVIRSIVVQEMLHMAIACNLLIALGGRPVIDKPCFIPTYPGPLPMSIGHDLIVPIEKCSIDLVQNVFMKIEEPEDPIHINALASLATQPQFSTIGAFYDALEAKLLEMGPTAFSHGRFDEEVVDSAWFPADQLFRIVDDKTAAAGIRLIVRQGEGTHHDPLDPEHQPAHYYRFEQIVKGHMLVRDPAEPSGFKFAGAPVPFDAANVWDMQPNPPLPSELPAGSVAQRAATIFAFNYTALLRGLHDAFNGAPSAFSRTLGQMYALRPAAQTVLQTPLPGAPGTSTGLNFTYQPTMA
ncbi:MAG TPA: ferritin-like protein [Caulobacteraceae bacterium]|jgi:rubrerythrin